MLGKESRLLLVEKIIECRRCELHKVGNGPIPFYAPGRKEKPNGIGILGEAPGRVEDAEGQPFVGPAGQLLRKHLTEVGITPERCFIFNTVSCWPNGTPKPEHIAACAPNKTAQLTLAGPKWLLVLGKVAMSAIRPGLRISTARGKPFRPIKNGPVCFVTYHPAAALRSGKYETAMREDIEAFMRMCKLGRKNWHQALANKCWECEAEDPVWFDIDGVAWCDKHAPEEYLERMRVIHEEYLAAKARIGV